MSDKVQLFQKNFMMEKGEKNKGVSRMPDVWGKKDTPFYIMG